MSTTARLAPPRWPAQHRDAQQELSSGHARFPRVHLTKVLKEHLLGAPVNGLSQGKRSQRQTPHRSPVLTGEPSLGLCGQGQPLSSAEPLVYLLWHSPSQPVLRKAGRHASHFMSPVGSHVCAAKPPNPRRQENSA